MAEQVGQAFTADLALAEMGVAVVAGSPGRVESLRWTIASRRRPISRSKVERSRRSPRGPRRRSRRPTDAPSRQMASRSVEASGGRRVEDHRQLLDRGADREAAAGRVLQNDQRRAEDRPWREAVRGSLEAVDEPSQAGVDGRLRDASRRGRSRTGPELGGVLQLVAHQLHGLPEQLVVRPGQVDEVGGVDGDRPDVQLDEPPPERLGFGRRLGPARQAVGLSLKICRADAPISAARSRLGPGRGPWAGGRRLVARRAAGREPTSRRRSLAPTPLTRRARSISSGYPPRCGPDSRSRSAGPMAVAARACTRPRSPARSARSRRCGACTERTASPTRR
jgi:hypothetical protein